MSRLRASERTRRDSLSWALTLPVLPSRLRRMELHITPTPDQEAFIREAIASGRFATAEEAAREALRQWEERERRRKEILVDLDAAEASLARGEGRQLTPRSIQDLAKDVKRRGRSRLQSNR